MRANGKMSESELEKVSMLLWCMVNRGTEIFNTLYPNDGDIENMFEQTDDDEEDEEVDEEDANAVAAAAARAGERAAQRGAAIAANPPLTLAAVLRKFDEYCLPQKNLAMESFKFHTIAQREKQSFGEFEMELRTQLQYCGFECSCKKSYADRMLRDRIIVGVYDKKLQMKLLGGKDEPLSEIVNKCKVFEAAAANKRVLGKRNDKSEAKVNAVEATSLSVELVRNRPHLCYNCGRRYTKEHRESCPALKVECRGCGKIRHFQQYCRSTKTDKSAANRADAKSDSNEKSVKQVGWNDFGSEYIIDESLLDEYSSANLKRIVDICSIRTNNCKPCAIHSIESWSKTYRIEIQLIKFKLDTGADVSCIPKHKINEIQLTKNVLTDYGSNKLHIHGTIKLTCFDTERLTECSVLFHVVDEACEPLLGLPEYLSLGLIKRVATVQSLPSDAQSFVERHRE